MPAFALNIEYGPIMRPINAQGRETQFRHRCRQMPFDDRSRSAHPMSYRGRETTRRNSPPYRDSRSPRGPRDVRAHPDTGEPRRSDVAPSQAWAAAQAAFAAPHQPRPSELAPLVVVKRSRVAGAIEGPRPVVALPSSDAPIDDKDNKGPRVFRVEAAAAEPVLTPPAPPQEQPAEAAPLRRRRRVADHMKPGPVVLAFQAPPAASAPPPRQAREPADLAGPWQGLSAVEARTLRTLLARLEPVLEDIRRAQSLQFLA